MNILVRKNNRERGPYTEAELRERLKSGVFLASDLGQIEGESEWRPLSEILLASVLAAEKLAEAPAATPDRNITYPWLRQPKVIGGAIVLLLLTFGGINWLNRASDKRHAEAAAARQAAVMEQAQKQEAAILQQQQERADQARQAQLDQVKQLMAMSEKAQRDYQEKQKREEEERHKAAQAKVEAEERQKQQTAKRADERRVAAEAQQKAQEQAFAKKSQQMVAVPSKNMRGGSQPAPNVTLNSIPLGPLPKTYSERESRMRITPDGSRVFVVASQGSRVQAVVDGQPGPLCRNIRVPKGGGDSSKSYGLPPFSPDKLRCAYIAELDGGKECVVVDGVQSPLSDKVDSLVFGPKGHHFAYLEVQRGVGVSGRGTRERFSVVDNGKRGPLFDLLIGSGKESEHLKFVFSDDSEHLGYIGMTASANRNSQHAVFDGREQGQEHKSIKQLALSRDGKHVAYIATDYIPNNTGGGYNQDTVILDGKADRPFYEIKHMILSSDGSRCVYVGETPARNTGGAWSDIYKGSSDRDQYQVVDNGKVGPAYDEFVDLQVSANGQRAAYIAYSRAGDRNDYFVVDNGKASAPYDQCGNLQVSDDGGLLSFITESPQGKLLVVNGQEFGPFYGIAGKVVFSGDAKHWGCEVKTSDTSGSRAILLDGQSHPIPTAAQYGSFVLAFDSDQHLIASSKVGDESKIVDVERSAPDSPVPSQIVYNRDRQHVVKVFARKEGSSDANQQLTLDDKPIGPLYLRVHHVQVSDDGKHVAFIGMYNGTSGTALTHVNFDGEEGPAYLEINGLAMTPDGKHIAYAAEEKTETSPVWHVVVDGFAGPTLEEVLGEGYWEDVRRMSFSRDGSLTFLAALKGQLARYVYRAEALKFIPTMGQTESVTAGLRVLRDLGSFTDVAPDLVLGPNETLYGVQSRGGEHGSGALFSCKTDGSDFRILHSFYGDKESGPTNSLAGDQENVWGTAGSSVFGYNIKKREYRVVTSERHLSGLRAVLPDGSLLGEEGFGDRHWWMLSKDRDSLETTPRQEGIWHQIALVGPDGAIYWTASDSLYRQTSFWSEPSLLHKFLDSPEEGADLAPFVTVDPQGTIYGFSKGRTGQSIIYRVRPDASDFRVLLKQSQGLRVSSLVAGDDGMLYGCFTAELKTADSQTAGFFSLPADGGNPTVLPNINRGTDHALIYHQAAIYYTTRSSVVRVQLPSVSGATRLTPVVTIKTVAPPALVSAEPVSFTTSSGEAISSAKAPYGQAAAAIWQPPAPGSIIATVSKQSPSRGPSSGGNSPNANFGNAAPSGQGLSQQEATLFAMTNVSVMSAGDINALASFYANQVDYQDKGVISNDAVRNEFQQYFARWPQTNWQLAGTVAVQPVDASKCQITFPVSFEAVNPATNKRAAGTARQTMILGQDMSGTWRIVMERQTITSKKSDGGGPRPERERVYEGKRIDPQRPNIPLPPNIPWPPGIPHP
jgi:hypothetical protein